MCGKLIWDSYEDRVLSGWNTADRIGSEYRAAVDAVLDSQSFPYNVHIGFGDIEFVSSKYKDEAYSSDYVIITDELVRDAYYNVNELGAKSGKLTVYIEDSDVTPERMAHILLGIRQCFDSAGVGFYAIDCVLEYPRDENGYAEDGRVEVMDFLYTDIYEEGILERVSASNQAAKDYHAEQDAQKLKEMEENY
jgi:hypothetical protein